MFHLLHSHRGCGTFRGPGHQPFAGFGGRGGGPRERFAAGFTGGGGRERMFDGGEFQLVLLHLVEQKPSYGYELIKTLEEKLAGGYAPSPGVVYPTLTLLEEEGFATSTTEAGRKVYTATEAGRSHLAANKARLDEILGRLNETGEGFQGGNKPEFRRAFRDLQRAVMGAAMKARRTRGKLTPEQLQKMVDAIDSATRAIDEL